MNVWQGMLINLQFFTVIPIRREIPMGQKQLTRSVQTFPLLGLLQGLLASGLLYALLQWTPFSTLSITFFVWLFMIVLTGGLHLDGWMDASDAFFSYRDLEKRLEIMKDPRTGAFGVLSVIILLAAKFLFLYEIAQRASELTYLFVLLVPFFSKSVMGIFLVQIQPAKAEGLAAFFQNGVKRSCLWIYPIYWLLIIGIAAMISLKAMGLTVLLSLMTLIVALWMKRKIVSWFNGITGDVLGASVEGMEVLLWMSVWLLHYFVMG
ncbi:adenosylcobinamide-GDP ribazoletransferase [Bacillus sp. RAR_GA_16]|uniref:adenosylcobinamide-GDP ribazoletransferase n=1 Tax=Bacillus sp. RAR_GA_16 TaxID=2876774 RepID=UPI001CCB4CE2|nr:adenosylcobinamide-GDP ribazoletransferase [Bacillus sp. RAR_GA_16]MCA0170400.1 adenosylcobinamide-GDP ribazoletransferase [Bacillus sp. RAR_GA_16]